MNQLNRYTIIRRRILPSGDTNAEIQWFCEALGLFGDRDKDSSCYRIFIELLSGSKGEQGLSSDRIAYKLNLSRGTVMHHINKMILSGIVISERNRYFLRVQSLTLLIDEIEKDVDSACKDIKKIAGKIDKSLNL